MPLVRFDAASTLSISSILTVFDVLAGTPALGSVTPTEVQLQAGGFAITLQGSGLTASGGALTAGVISAISVESGGQSQFEISGLTLDIEDWADLLAEEAGGNAGAIEGYLLALPWELDLGAANDVLLQSTVSGDGIPINLAADNVIRAGDGFDRIFLGDGNDTAFGEGRGDRIWGGTGDDTIDGGNGFDFLWGGEGNDSLQGGNGKDVVRGNAGNDTVRGGAWDDQLFGGTGDDTLFGDRGKDTLNGGEGNDRLSGGDWDDELYGAEGNDTLFGGRGKDFLSGGDGHDELYGGDWDDELIGNKGDDLLDGGKGRDTLSGHAGKDELLGREGNDLLYGNNGDDTLNGGADDDILAGGTGNDTLRGGAGADRFLFRANEGADVITDFEIGVDEIKMDGIAGGASGLSFADQGADLLITVAGGGSVLLQGLAGTAPADIDFVFT
ncbi:Bifunctional hemolysin/adenylate cyclase precursor [Pseudoruegeria aquimaris]|uniref:Bifunctional hemolysin/adenylate cyclase n=1 Tax=Pseudoruegeria aquimaris TaxID=393663 RepID=A0A1Y5SQ75_9RHOB|nr:calcium-binding protein [Pseudoruegeria aquimaris]SLN45241.1 Bifunctional hemolysin/adenylate cyclase precursor [Pseudoruegeria aquimaris]